MDVFYTFHQSVQGHLHVLRDLPVQDASASGSDEAGRFQIAVVADGHGDPACVRSAAGSVTAVETAKACLLCFAREMLEGETAMGEPPAMDALSIRKYRDAALKRLTDSIVSRWYAAVHQDAAEDPLPEEALEYGVAHAYGTTLIAALRLPDYLVLIQQGDGLCVVFYEDGSAETPIPPDTRCHENVTTSLCDNDAAEGIRACVLDLRNRPVAACFLGSDGVEDSFRDLEGTYTFYRKLTYALCEQGTEAFEQGLEEHLRQFSAQGSGDDISVSGIVNLETVGKLAPEFRRQVQYYELSERLMDCEQKQASMTRKHGILLKRMQDARKEFEALRSQLGAEETELQCVEQDYQEAVQKAQSAQADWQASAEKYEDIQAGIKEDRNGTLKRIFGIVQECRSVYNGWQSKRDHLEIRLSSRRKAAENLTARMDSARQQYQCASDEFADYDQTYQAVLFEIERIRKELESAACPEPPEADSPDGGQTPDM